MTPTSYHPGPADPTPQQRLLLMNDTEWEQFIEDCVTQLKKEGEYTQVIRLGGPGDKGRDVCGYTVHPPTDGTWDLYQGKYYSGTLSPVEFESDLAKFLSNVYDKEYPFPRNYFLCALKIGNTLLDLILNPDSMRAWIIEEWGKKNGKFPSYTRPLNAELKEFILNFPFNIIRRKTPSELLEIHGRNAELHWEKFGVLGKREDNPPVPEKPDVVEQKYVEALLRVYAETAGLEVPSADDIPANLRKHFRAMRRLFYCAEGLNRFSRDKLPGAFDELLDQVEVGISGVVAAPHDSGMTRLRETLDVANSLSVTSNPLSARLAAGDLQGTCHHLANQDRVSWVEDNEKE